MALKCADICNPCRPWELSKQWSEKVTEEFFQQGICLLLCRSLLVFWFKSELIQYVLLERMQETLRRSTNLKSAHFVTERQTLSATFRSVSVAACAPALLLFLVLLLILRPTCVCHLQASWPTWQSRCLQSGLVSPTHVCPKLCWATWVWTKPAGAACSRNKPRSQRRRSPAQPPQQQQRQKAAPKKYLREAENPDTPCMPFGPLTPLRPQGLTTLWWATLPLTHLILTPCFRLVALASHPDKPLILFI